MPSAAICDIVQPKQHSVCRDWVPWVPSPVGLEPRNELLQEHGAGDALLKAPTLLDPPLLHVGSQVLWSAPVCLCRGRSRGEGGVLVRIRV